MTAGAASQRAKSEDRLVLRSNCGPDLLQLTSWHNLNVVLKAKICSRGFRRTRSEAGVAEAVFACD